VRCSLYFIFGIVITRVTSVCIAATEPSETPLQLQQTIALRGVEGRIDHLDVDSAGERLFVCALGNNTVEVLGLGTGERIHSIDGLGAPQGLACLTEFNRLLVANDKGGLCQIYDAKSWRLLSTLNFEDDADNVRYDAATKQVYVGFGNGAIGVVNASDGKRIGSIKLTAHPEAFVLEKQGRRIFVNVPKGGQVAVIDRDKGEVIATWKLAGISANFPMAIDETSHRLFVGCRNPAKLAVLNTDSGSTITTLDISGDVDEIFYDAKRHRLYAIAGEGFIDVIEQADADHYKRTGKLPTASGARTGLFLPASDDLFIAIPGRGAEGAEIRRYRAK
jgi:DNA-binding beta-propeller fold protein YncE